MNTNKELEAFEKWLQQWDEEPCASHAWMACSKEKQEEIDALKNLLGADAAGRLKAEARSKELSEATMEMIEVLKLIEHKSRNDNGWDLGSMAQNCLTRHASLIDSLKRK